MESLNININLFLLWITVTVIILGRYEPDKIKAIGDFFKDLFNK